MSRRILVAGVGNVFFGDDAFGCHVARRLRERPLPPGAEAIDFGIRGLDLGFHLLDYQAAILVDATARGGAPGTLYVIDPTVPEPSVAGPSPATVEGHDLTPDGVLGFVRSMGGALSWVRLVGCEPAALQGEDGALLGELSAAVSGAVAPAVALVESLLSEWSAHA